mmetsp:Transcript_63080/g.111459  ORF Transcript_63080/g.111459 Transcript_63080/m.111459 type:complete len:217 (+) Transcript_63080:1473-2123(+)
MLITSFPFLLLLRISRVPEGQRIGSELAEVHLVAVEHLCELGHGLVVAEVAAVLPVLQVAGSRGIVQAEHHTKAHLQRHGRQKVLLAVNHERTRTEELPRWGRLGHLIGPDPPGGNPSDLTFPRARSTHSHHSCFLDSQRADGTLRLFRWSSTQPTCGRRCPGRSCLQHRRTLRPHDAGRGPAYVRVHIDVSRPHVPLEENLVLLGVTSRQDQITF